MKILTKEKRLKKVKKIKEKELIFLHSQGFTDRKIAKHFNVSPSTIYRWRAKLLLVANHVSWNGIRKNENELNQAYNKFIKCQLDGANRRRKENLLEEREKEREYAEKRRKDDRCKPMMLEQNRKYYIKNVSNKGVCLYCGKKTQKGRVRCNSCFAKSRLRDKLGLFALDKSMGVKVEY